MSETAHIPHLRFPEFSGEWETVNVIHIIKDIKGAMKIGPFGSQLKKDTFVKDGYKVYGQENIFLKDFEFGDRHITEEHFHNLKTNELHPGDFVISTMGTIGKSTIVPENIKRGIMDSHMIRLQLDEKIISSNFLGQLFDSFRTLKQAKRLSVGGIMDGLSIGIVKEIKFTLPQSIPEQQKIAAFLTAVDSKIKLLGKKQELLKAYKKGLMQKIFAQEIRFKADDGSEFADWEEKKLGDVFSGTKGQGLSKSDITIDGLNKCILYGELYTTYPEVIKNVVSRTNLVNGIRSKSGDLLVPCSTTTTGIDLADVTVVNEDNVLLGGDISVLRFKKDGNSVFFAYYLTHYKKFDLAKYGQGSTIVHLYYSHFKKIDLKFPSSIEEQTKIANFLSSIDSKIEQVGKQLDESKQFKKALLQQMFV